MLIVPGRTQQITAILFAVGVFRRGRGADCRPIFQLGHGQQHTQLHSGEPCPHLTHAGGLCSGPAREHGLHLQGDYGPFQPNFPVKVPLWLAVMLHKRKKCRIRPPDWMQSDHLQGQLAAPQIGQIGAGNTGNVPHVHDLWMQVSSKRRGRQQPFSSPCLFGTLKWRTCC